MFLFCLCLDCDVILNNLWQRFVVNAFRSILQVCSWHFNIIIAPLHLLRSELSLQKHFFEKCSHQSTWWKHEDPSLESQDPHKYTRVDWWVHTCTLSSRKAKTSKSRELTSQASLLDELQVNYRPCFKMIDSVWERTSQDDLCLRHVPIYMCMCRHTNIQTCTHID